MIQWLNSIPIPGGRSLHPEKNRGSFVEDKNKKIRGGVRNKGESFVKDVNQNSPH